MISPRNQARIEQSQLELAQLEHEVASWLAYRRRQDSRQQYKAQLDSLQSLLLGAIAKLRTEVDATVPTGAAAIVYDQCYLHDRRVIWLRKIWSFFAEKFDQRDHKEMGQFLTAADEVAWSCFRPVFAISENLGRPIPQSPVPLPYIENDYSPMAATVSPDTPIFELLKNRGSVDSDFINAHWQRLPIPLVALPPFAMRSPWWLVFLGHEIGHHLQDSLLEKVKMRRLFREQIGAAVRNAQGEESEIARWEKWSEEIFADLFSVMIMGPAALLGMNELLLKRDEMMIQPRATYPAPATRLLLLVEIAKQLKLKLGAHLKALEPAPSVKDHLLLAKNRALIQPVVSAILKPLPELNIPLQTLCSFQKGDFAEKKGEVWLWARALLGPKFGPNDRPSENTLPAARHITSGAVESWHYLLRQDDTANRLQQRSNLAERTLQVITENNVRGTRSSMVQTKVDETLGDWLAQLLLQASREELAALE